MKAWRTKTNVFALCVIICTVGSGIASGQGPKHVPGQDEQKAQIQQKMDLIQGEMPKWRAAGGDHEKIAPLGRKVDEYLKAGNLQEAEVTLDQILAIVQTPSVPTARQGQNSGKLTVQPGRFISKTKPIKVADPPRDSAIIFWSVRHNSDRPDTFSLGPSELYTMNIDGRNVTQITFDNPQSYEHAALSHDRRFIVAVRYLKGGVPPTGMWIIDLQDKAEARLVPDFYSAGGGGVDWSPDGFIYFAGQPGNSKSHNLYRIRPSGSDLTQLTFLVQDSSSVPPEPAGVSDVSVSEDGSMVAYVRLVAKKLGNDWVAKTQIWLMNSDGTDQRMVHDGGLELGMNASGPIGAFDPELSPDNKYIVFSLTNTKYKNFKETINTAHDLWIVPVDKSTPAKRLTPVGPVSIIPDWQDSMILYTEYNEGEHYVGLSIINPDGSAKKRLEPNLKKLWDGGRHGKFIH